MRHATLGVIILLVAGLFCLPARADYTGLVVVREFAGQMTVAGPRDVFRVYAEFTSPTDRVDRWYGTAANPFVIQNILADGSLGSGFTNFGNATMPPEIPGTPIDWDTWATIGLTNDTEGLENTTYASTSTFPSFIPGNSVSSNSGSIFVPEGHLQGSAGWRVAGLDTNLRVLLMQLVVMPGQHVRGTINIHGLADTGSGFTGFTVVDQSFNSIPSPGGLLAMISAILMAPGRGRWGGV